jgi:hypothetical protein
VLAVGAHRTLRARVSTAVVGGTIAVYFIIGTAVVEGAWEDLS